MLTVVFDSRPVFEMIASVSGAVALWASTRARRPEPDPLEDLTHRLRRPARWTLAHPARAIRRALRGR